VTGAFLRPRRFATIFRRKVSVVKQLVTRAMNAPKSPPPPAIAGKSDDSRNRYDRDNQPLLDDLRAFFFTPAVDDAPLDCNQIDCSCLIDSFRDPQ